MSSTDERGPFVGSMMRVGRTWVMEQVYAGAAAAGYTDIGRAHIALFSFPSPDGARPSELAERLQITKQSVNGLLRDLERAGYLIRTLDPTDGRARVIRLTERGEALLDVVTAAAHAAEEAIASLLGPERFTAMRDALEDVVRHINGGDMPGVAPRH